MKEFTEQPKEYNHWTELVDWLIWDLYQQRKSSISQTNKTYSPFVFNNDCNRENEFLKKIIDNGVLTLNIGSSNINITEINFYFYYSLILGGVGGTAENEKANIIYPYRLNCERVIFNQDANFNGVTFNHNPIFKNSIFNQNANFINSTFNQNIYFINSIFNQNANFINSTFNQNIYFINSIFNQNANFTNSTFNQNIYFEASTFESKISFKSAIFEKTMRFRYINLNDKSHISFRDINYDIKNNKFIENENSKIEIINTAIKGRIEFDNVAIDKIDFKGTIVIGTGVISTDELNVQKYATWKTARFLKHEAYKISNTIEALKYKAIEKELYTTELKGKKDKSVKDYGEIFSLWISKISNDHGQDWIRAVLFTLISGFFFFSLSVATGVFDYVYYTVSDMNIFFMNYLNYIIPTNFDLIKCVNTDMNIFNLILFAIFYLLGKISVGYGIFEIIQAFRKYNTKGN